MRVSIERRSVTGSSGSILRTTSCRVVAQGFRPQARAGHHEDLVVGAVTVRIVDRALGLVFDEPRLLHRADDADDREGLGVGPLLGALEHPLADRAALRPIEAREVLVDHADPFGAA